MLLEKGEIDTIGAMAKKQGVSFSRGVSMVIKDHVRSVILAASNKVVAEAAPGKPPDGGSGMIGLPGLKGVGAVAGQAPWPPSPVPSRKEIEEYIIEKGMIITADEVILYYGGSGWTAKSGKPVGFLWRKGVAGLNRGKKARLEAERARINPELGKPSFDSETPTGLDSDL